MPSDQIMKSFMVETTSVNLWKGSFPRPLGEIELQSLKDADAEHHGWVRIGLADTADLGVATWLLKC